MSDLETLPDDAALFSEAVSDEAPVITPEAEASVEQEPEAKPAEQPRDEQGKFAKAEPEKIETPAEKLADDDKDGKVPSWRVREINAEKAEIAKRAETAEARSQRLESELAELRRQQKPALPAVKETPDPLLDPDGYRKAILDEARQEIQNERRNQDMAWAHRQHGKVFEDAYAAAQEALKAGDVQLKALMNATSTPGETLVKWHREQQTMREVGNDPNAWLEKKLEERMNDPAFLAKAVERARGAASTPSTQTGVKPTIQLPPSLSNTTRADNLTADGDDSDISDAALFAHATR